MALIPLSAELHYLETDETGNTHSGICTVHVGRNPEEQAAYEAALETRDADLPQVTIQLYRYDGTLCLAVVDGKSVCLVKRFAVMELVEAVQSIVLN